MEYLQVFFWAIIGSVFSLIGGLVLIKAGQWRKTIIRFALPFGAGALLAAAFISMLPEALEHGAIATVMLFALGGFLGFFILERMVGWFHHHHHHDDIHGARDKTHVAMVVIGDTLHNAIDGMAIGAAFLVNPAVGVTTSLAIAAHEVPQEIGDFGIMLGKGVRPRRAILINLISALATLVMALLTFWLGGLAGVDPAPFMAIAAGMFIYVAASDLIPEIHEQPPREGNLQALMLLVGVVVIGTVSILMPHNHDYQAEPSHSQSSHLHHHPTEHDHSH